MSKAKDWLYSFLACWEECRDRNIKGAAYARNLTELYKLCEADMGKSWAKRVYRLALKAWEKRQFPRA